MQIPAAWFGAVLLLQLRMPCCQSLSVGQVEAFVPIIQLVVKWMLEPEPERSPAKYLPGVDFGRHIVDTLASEWRLHQMTAQQQSLIDQVHARRQQEVEAFLGAMQAAISMDYEEIIGLSTRIAEEQEREFKRLASAVQLMEQRQHNMAVQFQTDLSSKIDALPAKISTLAAKVLVPHCNSSEDALIGLAKLHVENEELKTRLAHVYHERDSTQTKVLALQDELAANKETINSCQEEINSQRDRMQQQRGQLDSLLSMEFRLPPQLQQNRAAVVEYLEANVGYGGLNYVIGLSEEARASWKAGILGKIADAVMMLGDLSSVATHVHKACSDESWRKTVVIVGQTITFQHSPMGTGVLKTSVIDAHGRIIHILVAEYSWIR